MFFQELLKHEGSSELVKLAAVAILGVVSSGITGVITFYLTRSKSESETVKNLADAHKSEADGQLSYAQAEKIRTDTLVALNNELDEVIIEVIKLRGQVRDLSETEDAHRKERNSLRDEIKTIAYRLRGVISLMSVQEISTVLRQDAVNVLESLFKIAEKLKPASLELEK
jgi:hypothetical protein